jgi:hypothetical protein
MFQPTDTSIHHETALRRSRSRPWVCRRICRTDLQCARRKMDERSRLQGKCYEIYGLDKAGKKVEIYFDPATGAELERK